MKESESILQKIADRDRATDSPLPAAIDAVLAEIERLRASELRLCRAMVMMPRYPEYPGSDREGHIRNMERDAALDAVRAARATGAAAHE